MKNRTVYDVLDSVMENYTYTNEREGRKVTLYGKVYIERIDVHVSHEKTIYLQGDVNDEHKLEGTIRTFKDELKGKVAEVIKGHAEELTDDEAMIDKLLYEVKVLTKKLGEAEEELALAREKIARLENERLGTQPYQPYPWTNPNPWATGITWETKIGDPPGWMDNTTTCDENNPWIVNKSFTNEKWAESPDVWAENQKPRNERFG
jgi:hypothetical protein